ncbi:hypothetical protein DICPUDRAFT_56450 [Dictyostelium purpureum]|uniref:Periplasmic copper-binding protein NosD beta helix domain-containing protein n=1 Tax=Dictyostelium purpureum TaxID=5786 RepID=F0ZRP4_DICPU|nr:uncharacterized protein DICPUDRAFT_56450 [Dictyostelium purpureum]EGC33385.1 hypothetical protein DICPUDRAFT_56450 [Dictyostelium purpureum]|eukprot:XP_003290093.1 hypothetical protein DICPUDRAFT_56450 [Dictyostelium purpureum]
MKKFVNKITNMFDDYSNPNQKLPSKNPQQQQQQQPQHHYGYQQPPPYGHNSNNNIQTNSASPYPGCYLTPQQQQQANFYNRNQNNQNYQQQPQQNNYYNGNSNNNANYQQPQQYYSPKTNQYYYGYQQAPPLTAQQAPPLSPPITNITNHHNNHHHHHYYDNTNGSPNLNKKLSPPTVGSKSSNRNLAISPIPGAYGDGVHDDTQAVTNYFKQFPNNQITIPPGSYLITQCINISRANLQLLGSPDVKFLCNFPSWPNQPKSGEGTIDTTEYVFNINADNVILDSLNISCAFASPLSASCIYFCGNGFIIRNCIIDNFNQGIVFGKLNDCSGKVPPNSVYSNIKITQNQITNIIGYVPFSICYGDGICFFGCLNVLISNNFVSAKPGFTPRNGINSGPEGFVPSTNVQVLNNTIRGDWDYALTTEGGDTCILQSNDIEGSCICGIIERGKDVKVISNVIHLTGRTREGASGSTGIQFYGVHGGEISNNTIMGSGDYGMLIKPSHETKGGTDTLVQNNTVDGAFGSCIMFVEANGAKVYNNVILGKTEQCSVGLQLWYSSGLDVKGNNLDIQEGTACICSGMKDVNVCSNTMMSSKAGFWVCQKSDNIQIENNDLLGITGSKFGQSDDNTNVATSQNYGLDYNPPQNNSNDSK